MGESEYQTAFTVMGLYGGLLQEVVKQYGWEKAVEMNGKIGYPMGVGSGEAIKKAAGSRAPTPELTEPVNNQMMEGFGVSFKVSKGSDTLRYEVTRCPMYDGLIASGFSHEQVKSLCEAMASNEYEGIKSVVPNISGSVKVRDGSQGTCVEEFKFL